ncbi:molybdopterin-dependent oxidoreductase [Acidithiobacillus sp. VAN18-1]|uniref:Molybdopterin-dependent oxidoreductase n=1 Tax=Igneacidithiobacillus copahuensis TaxID=2724909 RepID=A0AAE2YP09_9PROT|nr:molybdopterin oxidoreductase family protein [Igneacidithiobacillus copahuensis]MBU2787527.1 molybdopterin-dependent oxidoreductase [Igneacidithiobacillus copahuensis]MBU2797088.1 molybdopterin-dependent oxidoreductase [Acidithiobacillus sp. VAN18-2]
MTETVTQFENHAKQRIEYSTCYMCACRCGIKVTVENNNIRFIQGNRNHPTNQGVLCAKGSAGIMKQNSPAKLHRPLMRKPGSERGAGEFVAISWDEALDILTKRLAHIRESNPDQLAFFTGRDQMQALSGLWAQQFGTLNWAAHGGFCSVNMAAGGLYMLPFAFWEFGDPDWDRTKYFMLWGVAEDHASNPIKIALEKLKRHGAKFVAINPARTGYQAIADEWVAIKPGTDGLLALAMVHVLLKNELFDWDFLIRYTNAPFLVIDAPGKAEDGLFWRNAEGHPMSWDMCDQKFVDGMSVGISPSLIGEHVLPDGRNAKTVFSLMLDKYLDESYSPEVVSATVGVAAETIERLALEMAHVAFEETITIACEWTDWAGRKHDKFIGRPVSMYAMRGVSAHSNGFQSARAIHLIQVLLGTIDCPGGFCAKPPYPKPVPPPNKPAQSSAPNTPLKALPLGYPTAPEDLVIDENGKPKRIDKAFSWDSPLAIQGLLHMVITNAHNYDPYRIDTLMLFMANMAWNSSMNTAEIQKMLIAKDPDDGEYRIPFIIVSDAFHSETVNFADLVLPDTTYLERYDTLSMLDRPISETDAVCDSIRHPILKPDRDVRAWQEVLVELAGRLQFPAFVNKQGKPIYKDYKDFIINYEREPGIGFLSGWRGENGDQHLRGEPNQKQWEAYIDHQSFFQYHLPEKMRYYRFANKDYLEFAVEAAYIPKAEPMLMELYSEPLQRFRLAGQGVYQGPCPKDPADRERLSRYFDPLPFWYEPLEQQQVDAEEYPFFAVNQRPMMMYHSWDSQNAWLRQIIAQNFLYMNRQRGQHLGIADKSWVWVESHNGKIRVQVKLIEGCQEDTVWTWNAIGKQSGAWGLTANAPEATRGFLMNHLISELLPKQQGVRRITNSDPITGQAAWYDLRVKIYPATPGEEGTWPILPTIKPLADEPKQVTTLRYHTHKPVNLKS